MMPDQFLLRAENLARFYRLGGRQTEALKGINLEISSGTIVAVRGRSGSGKTTLLNCLAGLDRPTRGHVWVNGQKITHMSEGGRTRLRRREIGFIFQSHALIPTYSAGENIDLMLRLAGWPRRARQQRVAEVLGLVDLGNWIDHRPFELSGGQQQRVSIARAIAARPSVVFADEPTGELDVGTGEAILALFRQTAQLEQTTFLIATHDFAVDRYADEILYLRDGEIQE